MVLGDCLDTEGSSTASWEFNTRRAEAHYYKNVGIYRNTTLPIGRRLQAWSEAAVSIATYNAETWHSTAHFLSQIRTESV